MVTRMVFIRLIDSAIDETVDLDTSSIFISAIFIFDGNITPSDTAAECLCLS